MGLTPEGVYELSFPHLLLRLKSAERLQARNELLRFKTAVRVADAAGGGNDGNARLNQWSEHLQQQAGVALTPAQKAAMNAQRFVANAARAEAEKLREKMQVRAIQREREKK